MEKHGVLPDRTKMRCVRPRCVSGFSGCVGRLSEWLHAGSQPIPWSDSRRQAVHQSVSQCRELSVEEMPAIRCRAVRRVPFGSCTRSATDRRCLSAICSGCRERCAKQERSVLYLSIVPECGRDTGSTSRFRLSLFSTLPVLPGTGCQMARVAPNTKRRQRRRRQRKEEW